MRLRTVIYHSDEWRDLVEQGWVTMQVRGLEALMLFDGRRR